MILRKLCFPFKMNAETMVSNRNFKTYIIDRKVPNWAAKEKSRVRSGSKPHKPLRHERGSCRQVASGSPTIEGVGNPSTIQKKIYFSDQQILSACQMRSFLGRMKVVGERDAEQVRVAARGGSWRQGRKGPSSRATIKKKQKGQFINVVTSVVSRYNCNNYLRIYLFFTFERGSDGRIVIVRKFKVEIKNSKTCLYVCVVRCLPSQLMERFGWSLDLHHKQS